MGRRSLFVGAVGGMAALVMSVGGTPANAGPEPEAVAVTVGGADYRLTLSGDGAGEYVARLTTSDGGAWTPTAGAKVAFALVGEGRLVGPALCFTPVAGECRIVATAAGADGAMLAAGFAGSIVTTAVGQGS